MLLLVKALFSELISLRLLKREVSEQTISMSTSFSSNSSCSESLSATILRSFFVSISQTSRVTSSPHTSETEAV